MFKAITQKLFGTENQRPDWGPRFKTPGPGTYVPPSDFGYVTVSPRQRLNQTGALYGVNVNERGSNSPRGYVKPKYSNLA